MPYGYGEADRQQKQRKHDSFRQDTAGGQERGTHGNRGKSGTTYYGTTGQEGRNFLNAVDRHYNRGDWGRTNQGADTTTYGVDPRHRGGSRHQGRPRFTDPNKGQRSSEREWIERQRQLEAHRKEMERRRKEKRDKKRSERLKELDRDFDFDKLGEQYKSKRLDELGKAFGASQTGVDNTFLEQGVFGGGDKYEFTKGDDFRSHDQRHSDLVAENISETGYIDDLTEAFKRTGKKRLADWQQKHRDALTALNSDGSLSAIEQYKIDDIDMSDWEGLKGTYGKGGWESRQDAEFFRNKRKDYGKDIMGKQLEGVTAKEERGDYKSWKDSEGNQLDSSSVPVRPPRIGGGIRPPRNYGGVLPPRRSTVKY